ncbi:MAG: BatA domain-containing protein [Gammaproteobacteria bacterium]|nr:BatA domain-containing protein [Gammaproteobacteria bacterium]
MDLPGAWLLLAPAGLFGLLAIAIPVAVHLISRGRGRRVLVGNIELVRAARQARVLALRLTQWLLLLLRVLIVILATLLLARLALQGIGSADADASYVTPGWLRSATDAEQAELLSLQPAARVLTDGYPKMNDHEPGSADPDYDIWPLLAERLSTLRHAGAVDVYTESTMTAFGSHRPTLPNEISWRLAAVVAEPAALESRGLVTHDPDRTDDARRLTLALAALKRHRVPRMQWDSCSTDDATCANGTYDWVVWLADAEPPNDIDSARLYRPQGPEWQLATSDPSYPEVLLDALLGEEQRRQVWQRVPASVDVLTAGAESTGSIPLPHRSLHLWLGLLLAVLWTVERLMSERRRAAND